MTINELGSLRSYNGCYFTTSGKAYRSIGTDLQEITGTRIGAKGHVIMTISGRTIYLARMIYCLFNDLDYDNFNDRIRYIDSDYSNCALSNLVCETKYSIVTKSKRQTVDPWAVRQMFAAGQQLHQISLVFGISADRVRSICLGFESVDIEQLEAIRRIIG